MADTCSSLRCSSGDTINKLIREWLYIAKTRVKSPSNEFADIYAKAMTLFFCPKKIAPNTLFHFNQTPSLLECNQNLSGQELPERYICNGNEAATLDASLSLLEIPVIDVWLLTSPSSRTQELEKLRLAINHGMREVGKQFFALSPEKMQKYSREVALEGMRLTDLIISEEETLL
ncbi:hypothetical protein WN944_002616 [Citrus x changshan-huyou]|uniref:Uncharacterized protein n=1 Tax=Citrus x changshan-huyou TaxID=2935761 RepID=A0AAP0MN40_9ROSI